MSDVSIRSARPDELAAVGALTLRAYQADDYFANGVPSSYGASLADARSRYEQAELLVAVDAGDRLLGTVTIAQVGTRYTEICRAGELEFRMLAVDPGARRRGVGEALIMAVLDRAREAGHCAVVLGCQERLPALRRMYERLGFQRAPERDWDPVPDVHLLAYSIAV
jgi:GNAT superfamily N-acetyltransferase